MSKVIGQEKCVVEIHSSDDHHHHHHRHRQERVRSEYEETLMKQRALFDEEIVALTEGMREEAKVCIM